MAEEQTEDLSTWEAARTQLWIAWAEIAVDAERTAAQARHVVLGALRAGEAPASGIEGENKAAMTAVVAAAIALEVMAKELATFAVPKAAKPASRRVVAAVEAAFGEGVLAPEQSAAVRDLFEERNALAHYSADWRELGDHPVYGIRTTHIASTYTLELATRAVDCFLSVLRAAVDPGLSVSLEAEFWAMHWRSLASEMEARRTMTR